ncbi:glycosyltransferase family 2 protein [Thermodesulfobacteriota bacterium]
MSSPICLNPAYSTTRLVTPKKSVEGPIAHDIIRSMLILSEGKDCKGEGGLRSKGYFKQNHHGQPLFTIVTVVYNGKDILEETILSIIGQTYENVEYIIVDGGSTDGTLEIIRKYEHAIDYWMSEKDDGIYDAMNKGIDLTTGAWINFMNAGDTFAVNTILKDIANQIGKRDIEIIYGGANVHKENGKCLVSLRPLNLNLQNLNRFASRTVCHQSILVSTKNVPKYDLRYKLKGELNWYYELIKRVEKEKRLKMDFMICNYILGGTGDKQFWKNYKERILVTKNNIGWLRFILTIPFFFIPLFFRFKRLFQ